MGEGVEYTGHSAVSEHFRRGCPLLRCRPRQGVSRARGHHGLLPGHFPNFPDFKMEIMHSAVTGEAAAGEWVMSGTFLGESFGVPPTGKSFRVQGCCYMRLLNGRIIEHRDYWNPAMFD